MLPPLELGLGLSISKMRGGLDADAAAYIAAVETALGSSISGDQKNAINDFIKTGKSDGWYSSIKRLYLPIWADAAANAIDMISLTSGTFPVPAGVTHGTGYIQGNGSTGYFDPGVGSEPNTLGLSNSSAALFAILLNNTDIAAAQVGSSTSTIAANNRFQFYIFGNQQYFACPTLQATTFVQTNDNITDGVFIGSVTATNSRYLYRRTTAGTAIFSNGTTDTTALSTHRPFVLARNNTGTPDVFCSNARVGVAGWGLAVPGSDAPSFSLALKDLWETVSGLTLEGAEYISAIRSAGATVTSTQESAIHNFIKTGKQQGWYSSLKRLYLPIWADAAANAIDMITRTSGTFSLVGVTHATGYVQSDGTTGYFDMGASPLDLGLTEDGMNLCYIALDQIIAIKAAIGSRLNIGAHYAIGTSSLGNSNASLGDNEGGQGAVFSGVTHTAGIQTASKVGDDLHLAVRLSTGWNVYVQEARSYASSDSSLNFFAMAQNIAGSAIGITAARFGAWAVGNGLSISTDESFTLALKNLWETASGLTLEGAEYVAALRSAGATVTSTQESAIHNFIKTGKQQGWYSSLKRLYLPIWADAAANAIDMITRTSGTFTASGVTHASGYVQGDGSTGRMLCDNNSKPSTSSYSNTDCHMAAVVYAAPTVISYAGGQAYGGRAFNLIFPSVSQTRFDSQGSVTSENPTLAFSTGVFVGGSNASNYRVIGRLGAAGYTSDFQTSIRDVALADLPPAMMARFVGSLYQGYSNAKLGAFSLGNYLDPASYSMSLKLLWETCTGLTLEGAEYVAALRSAGATVTSTQEAAIHTFIKTGKQQGWYSSLKRLYLPIWADPAANALCMVSGTSGTFPVSGVTHASGYVQGDGASGYFDTGIDPSSLGQTPSTGMIGALLRGPTANAANGGVLVSTTERTAFANFTSANAWLYQHCNATLGGGQVGSTATRTGGIIVCSREGGNRSIFRRQDSGFDTVAQLTNPDYGTIPTSYNIFFMSVNLTGSAVNFSSTEYGAFYVGLGMDSTDAANFSLALENLWETASGLSLS